MDEELLGEFLTESNENLASIEEQLLDLESDPHNAEILDGIFRVIHTVKGSCGFLGLERLERVAHAGENLLSKIRSLRFPVDGDIVSLLLEMTDAIKTLIEKLEETGTEPDVDNGPLCARLQAMERLIESMDSQPGGSDVEGEKSSDIEEETRIEWAEGYSETIVQSLLEAGLDSAEKVVQAGFGKLKDLPGFNPASALKLLGLASSLGSEPSSDGESLQAVVDQDQKSEPEVEMREEVLPAAVNSSENMKEKPVQTTVRKATSESIRVDVDLLDGLMNLVGELVLSRNRLLSLIQSTGGVDLIRTGRGISQITTQLQEQLLHTRMQPISTLWGTVPRLLRDISKQLNKKISVHMEGQETELDRTILAALKDPLTHIIRNSCDHGIENPEARVAKGKPDEGTIFLTAHQESGFIVINIRDDGNGIDPRRIREKALSMGVVTEELAEAMNDKAILQLIFHPGLSTAEQVSNLSGRGVGMDVVRSEIERVGGTVEIDSTMGSGTTLHIRIPLTLAIIPAMIVSSASQKFAVPQLLVQELIAVDQQEACWETIADKSFYRLRGKLLPILRLDDALGVSQQTDSIQAIVVVAVGEKLFGIGVDEVLGAEEIVVKQLGKHLQHLDVYGGCSILGDGMVVPILDCNGLGKTLNLGREGEAAVGVNGQDEKLSAKEGQHILIFGQGGDRYAIPMLLIERLEDIDPVSIERSGDKEVLQYRDEVIPVLRWNDVLGEYSEEEKTDEPLKCLIISDNGRRVCLQVEEIIDVVREEMDIKLSSNDALYLGTAVLQGRSTEVVDVFEVLKSIDPNWFSSTRIKPVEQPKQILFVEDTIFFRNLVIPVLEGMGYEVWTANNGTEAIKILERAVPDLVLTDLEMPGMDGFELARWIINQPRLQALPVVALSSLPPEEYAVKAKDIGFADKLVKFDRKSLVKHLSSLLEHTHDRVISINAEQVSHDGKGDGR